MNLDLSMSFRLIYVSYACVFQNLTSDLIIIVLLKSVMYDYREEHKRSESKDLDQGVLKEAFWSLKDTKGS